MTVTDPQRQGPRPDDETAIRALIEAYERAIRDKDSEAAIACYTDDVVAYDLAPPLSIASDQERDPAHHDAWFDTWTGPLDLEAADVKIRVGENVAYAFSLRRMSGTKRDGSRAELWFRATAAFEKQGDRWLIAHVHNSVPFAMDGSDRALLDLKP